MDYEQKYKEICQELMSAYNTTSFIEVRNAIEKIHPELKESEDERIRREILSFLKEGHPYYCPDSKRRQEWLAYLEKQKDEAQKQFNLGVQAGREEVMYEMEKEQKPTEDTAVQKAFVISKKDYTLEEKCDASDYADTILPTSITYGENDEEYKLHKIIEAAFIAGKQKEQKPLSTEETELNSISFLEQLGYTCIPPGAEQKPTNSEKPKEWSEEDEDFLKRAIWYVENPAPSVVKDTNLTLWLKSLPERFNLQSKQEWSEEDLQHKSWILECLADGKRTMPQYAEDFHAAYNWLKSIRPQPKAELTLLDENIINAAVAFVEQNDHFNCWGGIDKHTVIKALRSLNPHWKPSEEQMEALKLIVSNKKRYAPVLYEIALDTLYNDLLSFKNNVSTIR